MSERLSIQQKIATGSALAIAAVGIAGCSEISATSSSTKPKVPIERCFDKPQPQPKAPEAPEVPNPKDKKFSQKIVKWAEQYHRYKEYTSPDPINLHYNPDTKFIDEAPFVDEGVDNRLKDGNVKIEDGKYDGSGFITTAPDGGQVVVTAAHVVAIGDLSRLTVTGSQEQKVSVKDGCYIYEKDGKAANLGYGRQKEHEIADIDLAVLRLSGPIGGTSLNLAKAYPKRGSWVELVNNQDDSSPEYPSTYLALTVSKGPSTWSNEALTGLEPWKKSIGGESSYTNNPGASGGLVADTRTGNVVGISYAGTTGYYDGEATSTLYGVKFDAPVNNQTGIIPVSASITGAEIIHRALDSPVY